MPYRSSSSVVLAAIFVGCTSTRVTSLVEAPAETPAVSLASQVPEVAKVQKMPTVAGLNDIVDLAAGILHACVSDAKGRVACWGDGRFYQLGDISTSGQTEPRFIPELDRVRAISAGFTATCAQLESGALACWGARYNGMVDEVYFKVKAPITVVSPIGWPRSFTVGGDRAALIGSDGGVSIWSPPIEAPIPIEGFSEAVEVAVGWENVCARRKDGTVQCLGPNYGGECGNGGDGEAIEPVMVAGASELDAELFERSYETCRSSPAVEACKTTLGGVVDLDAMGRLTCAVLESGRVACWGALDRVVSKWLGQLGFARVPILVPGVVDAVMVEVGSSHVCARRKGGKVSCWGGNDKGQLGFPPETENVEQPAREVPGLDGVVQLSSGGDFVCARLEGGKVSCWGGGPAPYDWGHDD